MAKVPDECNCIFIGTKPYCGHCGKPFAVRADHLPGGAVREAALRPALERILSHLRASLADRRHVNVDEAILEAEAALSTTPPETREGE